MIASSSLRPLTGVGDTPLCRFGSAAVNTTTPATIFDEGARPGEQLVRCATPALPGELRVVLHEGEARDPDSWLIGKALNSCSTTHWERTIRCPQRHV